MAKILQIIPRFIFVLIFTLITGYNCLAQNYAVDEYKLQSKTSEFKIRDSVTSDKVKDTNSYPTILSIGLGAHTYKFVNLYYYEINILPYIGQNFYIKTGLILYRERYYDKNESTTNLLYINLYFIHRWNIKQKVFIYGGLGFSEALPFGFIPNMLVRGDLKLNESIYLGIEINKGLLFGKNTSKYLMYPAVSFNFSVKL